jgi:hypothetical protein
MKTYLVMKEKGPHSAAAATTSLDDKNDAKGDEDEEEAKNGDTASVGSMFKSGMGIKL